MSTSAGTVPPEFFNNDSAEDYERFQWYAPEVFYGHTTNAKSDLFSLGVLLKNCISILTRRQRLSNIYVQLPGLLETMVRSDWGMRPSVEDVVQALKMMKGGETEAAVEDIEKEQDKIWRGKKDGRKVRGKKRN